METRRAPNRCPSCGDGLVIVKLVCPSCEAEVNGEFELCRACRLDEQSRRILDLFLAARGNLREVQRALGVSYPTARQRVAQVFEKLHEQPPRPSPQSVLERLRLGEIDVAEAERLLRGDD